MRMNISIVNSLFQRVCTSARTRYCVYTPLISVEP